MHLIKLGKYFINVDSLRYVNIAPTNQVGKMILIFDDISYITIPAEQGGPLVTYLARHAIDVSATYDHEPTPPSTPSGA